LAISEPYVAVAFEDAMQDRVQEAVLSNNWPWRHVIVTFPARSKNATAHRRCIDCPLKSVFSRLKAVLCKPYVTATAEEFIHDLEHELVSTAKLPCVHENVINPSRSKNASTHWRCLVSPLKRVVTRLTEVVRELYVTVALELAMQDLVHVGVTARTP